MAITLPLPVRVAAGLLATGIDVVRSLPEEIPAIPVALVGNAMRLSMKVQQEIATLATRGDELLGGVVGAPQENPSWAKFDDDEPAVQAQPEGRTRLRPIRACVHQASGRREEAEIGLDIAVEVGSGGVRPDRQNRSVDGDRSGHRRFGR